MNQKHPQRRGLGRGLGSLIPTAPAIVAASGCAPPMPPRPAVRIHLPDQSPP